MNVLVRQLLCVFALCWIGGVAAESQQRGALSPSAPVRMDYELPDVLPESGELALTLNLSTPVTSGEIAIEVANSAGVSILDGANASYRLPSATPIPHTLKLLLSADAARFVIVLVSVDGPMGTASRSYRVDLSPATASHATSKSVLKLMPATIPR